MQSFFAVKNDTVFPVISVAIDGRRVFYDVIKGNTSHFVPMPVGSITLTVYNNFEKPILDSWISLPPKRKVILSVSENMLSFI